jgi:hypothetical protein
VLDSDLFDPTPSEDTPIACDLSAIGDREGHVSHAEKLFANRKETREVDGGVALRFPGETSYAERILDFVKGERQCCPFLTFGITFEPEERAIWLFLGGGEQAESYIKDQFGAQ